MDTPIWLFLFIIANLAITAGYLFLAIAVVPKVRIQLMRTRIGGIGFFALCGLTHLNMALAPVFWNHHMSMADLAQQWYMLAIHVPQAICVWLFVSGVYIEMGDFGLLRLKRDADPDGVGAPGDSGDADSAEGSTWEEGT